jgi:gentisate 1,2-dioxygenase
LVLKGGDIVTPDRNVERRVLRLANPGLEHGTTHTMSAAIQLILPGERAPAHRHTATAIRWVISGQGAYTTVEGDKCYMERGDLILTPTWRWHDHGNEGDGPMIWMDGLDTPLVHNLEASFYEPFPEDAQPVMAVGESVRKYSVGGLKPVGEQPNLEHSPMFHYKWARTHEALTQLAEVGANAFDDVAMEFSNPSTGEGVLRSLACWIQMIRPGVSTRAHRHASSKIYQVFEGSGYSIIDGQRFNWTTGDTFCVPSWAWHEHGNESGEPAYLFSIHDTPLMTGLAIYREEPYQENSGHQVVTGTFSGKK